MNLNQSKILFIRSDRLGEFLLSLYAIKLVKENYPQSKILVLARKDNIEVTRGIDFIDEFIEYKKDFESLKGVISLVKILKSKKLKCVVVLNPKKEFHLASFLARVPVRVGYDRKWGFCLNKKIEDKKYLNNMHEVEYNIELVSLICNKKYIPQLEFPCDGLNTLSFLCKKGLDLRKKYIIVHPFSSNPHKIYPSLQTSILIRKIKEIYKKEVILIGSQEFFSYSCEIEKNFSNFINLCGLTSLRNLCTLFKYNCEVLISVDSGPMHLASFFKNKIIGLFSISSPKRWAPFGTQSLVIKRDKITDIKPQDILTALLDFLN